MTLLEIKKNVFLTIGHNIQYVLIKKDYFGSPYRDQNRPKKTQQKLIELRARAAPHFFSRLGYRVAIQVVRNLPFKSKQKLCFITLDTEMQLLF